MRQTDFKIIDSVVELHSMHAIVRPIVLEHVLGILLNNIDIIRKARIVVLHHWHSVLVLSYDLLEMFC